MYIVAIALFVVGILLIVAPIVFFERIGEPPSVAIFSCGVWAITLSPTPVIIRACLSAQWLLSTILVTIYLGLLLLYFWRKNIALENYIEELEVKDWCQMK